MKVEMCRFRIPTNYPESIQDANNTSGSTNINQTTNEDENVSIQDIGQPTVRLQGIIESEDLMNVEQIIMNNNGESISIQDLWQSSVPQEDNNDGTIKVIVSTQEFVDNWDQGITNSALPNDPEQLTSSVKPASNNYGNIIPFKPLIPTENIESDFDSDDSVKDKNYNPSEESTDEELELSDQDNLSDGTENGNVKEKSNNKTELPLDCQEKKLTRKRNINPEGWTKNIRKKRRNLGQEYINSKGNRTTRREMREPCLEKCRFQCLSKINDNERRRFFDYYWKLGSIDSQRSFINSCMSEINPTYRNAKVGSNRSKNFKYTFVVNDVPIQVCKTFFKNTLAINNRVIFTVTKKRDEKNMISFDKRGKHKNQRKISEALKDDIRHHINSFPVVDSHYCRARTKKTYIDGSLNIRTMYRLYVQE